MLANRYGLRTDHSRHLPNGRIDVLAQTLGLRKQGVGADDGCLIVAQVICINQEVLYET